MKKTLSLLITVLILLNSLFISVVPVMASKTTITRSIAMVFDNSGTMYYGNAWCRATYATEVFASMLNAGDTLSIHPMNPIDVNGQKYTMDSPFVISDPSQASGIREIYTESAKGDTHIESIDAAANYVLGSPNENKYVIVITDGTEFYENGVALNSQTKSKLEERFKKYTDSGVNILYLKIGSEGDIPQIDSELYTAKKASDSKDVLSNLTAMCNQIFARDILPESHISDNTINFDISLSKLIVFVQGKDVKDLQVTGKDGATATLASTAETHYSTKGAENLVEINKATIDESLQGMIVTYTDCGIGEYEISCTGESSNVEIYYEPDADLDFIFTDSEGNLVEPDSLYAGDYKVQYGLKDAKTGELIESDLIGDPKYEGFYELNGEKHPIQANGKSGETPISLKMDDKLNAELTASYLTGYSITKTSKDLGWPEGGIIVQPIPVGDLKVEISGGSDVCELQTLDKAAPYIVKVFYQDAQLTGAELQKVALKWNEEKSNAQITSTFKEDHYELTLNHKNPQDPLATKCGKCTLTLEAAYTADGSTETNCKKPFTYTIKDTATAIELLLSAPQTYFVVKDIDAGKSIKATVTVKGKPLSTEEFNALELKVDAEGIGYKVTPLANESAYEIKLDKSGKTDSGNYKLHVTAIHKDQLGRTTSADDKCSITLSTIPNWLRWLIIIIILLIIITVTYLIMHIKRLPTKLHTRKQDCEMVIGGGDGDITPSFSASIENDNLTVWSKVEDIVAGVTMDVKPADDSYLMTKQEKRKATVESKTVKKYGSADIKNVIIGDRMFIFNEETYQFEPEEGEFRNFDLKNGNTVEYSGTVWRDGSDQDFNVIVKLKYGKK